MSTETQTIVNKKTSNKKPKEPGKFNVLVLNDNVTPFEFVVALLIQIYKHDEKTAIDLTIQIHNQGKAVVGVYTYEVAEQKVIDGVTLARTNGYPLKINLEQQ